MTRSFSALLPAIFVFVGAASAGAGLTPCATGDEEGAAASFALEASRHKDAVPGDIAAPIGAMLTAGDGVRVTFDKNTVLDFWWVKGLQAKTGSAAPTWTDVEEGALVGAVRVSADFRDIRGRIIKPGTYTLRYGIQPQNGDHLGISPFREFLLLSPAAVDTDVAPRGHEGTVEISKRTIGGSHPAVWSIDPPVASDKQAVLSSHKTELDHDAIILEVPVVRDGQSAGTLKFGLVLVGRIEG